MNRTDAMVERKNNAGMTTIDIAGLTGKRHNNVCADTKNMLIELYGKGGLLKFQQTYTHPQNGQAYPCYRLPKKEVMVLVSGYSIKLRMKIITRLEELENERKNPILPDFTNPAIAARAWADEVEQKALAEHQCKKLSETILDQAPMIAAHKRIAVAEGSLNMTAMRRSMSSSA